MGRSGAPGARMGVVWGSLQLLPSLFTFPDQVPGLSGAVGEKPRFSLQLDFPTQ